MHALIVVESVFGNTRAVADAVAAGLATCMQVEVVDVAAPGTGDTGVDVLVVGGPTHAHGMTRPGTRKGALAQVGQPGGGTTGTGAGLREWLASLDAGGHRPAAALDTRFDKPRWLVGSAARASRPGTRSGSPRPCSPWGPSSWSCCWRRWQPRTCRHAGRPASIQPWPSATNDRAGASGARGLPLPAQASTNGPNGFPVGGPSALGWRGRSGFHRGAREGGEVSHGGR